MVVAIGNLGICMFQNSKGFSRLKAGLMEWNRDDFGRLGTSRISLIIMANWKVLTVVNLRLWVQVMLVCYPRINKLWPWGAY